MNFRIIACLLFSILCLKTQAQQKNTHLHIQYTLGFAELYGKSYRGTDKDMDQLLQLTTRENYFDYLPVSADTSTQFSKNSFDVEYNYRFSTSKPALYHLRSQLNVPAFEFQSPVRLLWLGPGTHTLDLYSVGYNKDDENYNAPQTSYRSYYDGPYDKENSFLESYVRATERLSKDYMQIIQERYQDYDDTTDSKKQRLIKKFASFQKTYFDRVDSTTQHLNALYTKKFPKPNPAFEAEIKPELQWMGYSFKISYVVFFLSAFPEVEQSLKNSFIKIAEQMKTEMDKQPVLLSVEAYRNFYFSSLFVKVWSATRSTPSISDEDMLTEIDRVIQTDFKKRPELAEYLQAALTDHQIQYNTYTNTKMATEIMQKFNSRYPQSQYGKILARKLQKKENELKKKKDKETTYEDDYTDSTTITDEVLADAIAPPVVPGMEGTKQADFWRHTLYTIKNKPTTLFNLKNKTVLIKAFSGNPESRDWAYCLFLEKKYTNIQFVYVNMNAYDETSIANYKRFKLKGQYVFLYSRDLGGQSDKEEDWSQYLYDSYWHLVTKQGLLHWINPYDEIEEKLEQKLKQ